MKGNSCFPRLILAAALLLSLAACAAQDTPAETDTAPLQEEPPASALQTLRADLDGDGTEDMVEYQVLEFNGSASAALALAINGGSVADALAEQGFRLTNPHAQCRVVDLDVADSAQELAFLEDGASADYATSFVRWDGAEAAYLGEVPGLLDDVGYFPVTIPGDGRIQASITCGILQTWFFAAEYRVEDGRLQLIEQPFYSESRYKTLDKEVLLGLRGYAQPEIGSDWSILEAGTALSLWGAGGSWGEEDGVLGAWVLASDADGTEYYLKIRDAVEVETAAGGWLDGAAALSGLASYG